MSADDMFLIAQTVINILLGICAAVFLWLLFATASVQKWDSQSERTMEPATQCVGDIRE